MVPDTDPMNRVTSNIEKVDDLTETELAYMAGFVDGEGSICIYRQQHANSWIAEVTIYNTHKETLQWLADRLTPAAGADESEDNRSHFNWSTTHSLRIRREKDVKAFLEAILPYLITKRPHAENVLELINFKHERDNYHFTEEQIEYQKELHERQRELNGIGKDGKGHATYNNEDGK